MRARGSRHGLRGAKAEACEFLRTYAGQTSSFYEEAKATKGDPGYVGHAIASILESFARYVEEGLQEDIPPLRRAQLDVVSDFLDQANSILEDAKFHPAAACILIGASLEEFLRNWIETDGIRIGNRKPSILTYATLLREANLISKQDIKDITGWGGLRNHAAHGHWDDVSDPQRIGLMLEGVNLFMRKYVP